MLKSELHNGKVLLSRIADGDEKAFSELFYQYLPVLKSFALKFTKSDYAAEEIIQNSFLKIWLNRDKLEEVENIKAYLYKYVSNECLSYLRTVLRQEKATSHHKNQHSDYNNDTIDAIDLNDLSRVIQAAVDSLPDQRKKIYQLSRGEGKTIPEIADQLNLSPNTVKNALVIALKAIRAQLVNYGFILALSFGLLKLLFLS